MGFVLFNQLETKKMKKKVNVHKGVNGNAWTRLFLVCNYFGGIGGNDVQFDLSRLSIWDDANFVLPTMSS